MEYRDTKRMIERNSTRIHQMEQHVNDLFAERSVIRLSDILSELGLTATGDDRGELMATEWGWSSDNTEFHELTMKEKYPNGCPCCGRLW